MILIHGTQLTKEQLPFSEIMNYTVETAEQFFKIKLKTVATSEVCLGVYLPKDLMGHFDIPEKVKDKLHYFATDEQLVQLLENGGKDEPEPQPEEEIQPELPETIDFGDSPEVAEEVQPEAFTTPPPVEVPTPTVSTSYGGFTLIDTVDVDMEPVDTMFEIPYASEDVDSYKQQLETKDRIIAQKDTQLLEVKKSLDDLYKLQDIQLAEIKSVYDKRIDEANKALSDAKKKLEEVAIPEDLHGFLKYASYYQNHKAIQNEGYSRADIERLGKLTSKVHIFATASGDSLYTFMKEFNSLIETRPNALIVDFTNDMYLKAKLKINTRSSSMSLKDNTVKIQDIVRDINGTQIIPTTLYNDIALLSLDWIDILKRLNAYAKGRPIILLFNTINSFSVRHTVSKLGTLGDARIFVNCNPVILTTLVGDKAFIPNNRYRIVAMNYIDLVEPMLRRIGEGNGIIAFKQGIVWKKIGLNL